MRLQYKFHWSQYRFHWSFGWVDNDECNNGDNNCNAGYSGEGNDDDCTDIDECATDTKECHDVSTCTNNIASYECTCLAGYN